MFKIIETGVIFESELPASFKIHDRPTCTPHSLVLLETVPEGNYRQSYKQ